MIEPNLNVGPLGMGVPGRGGLSAAVDALRFVAMTREKADEDSRKILKLVP